MERVVGRAGETDLLENRLMSTGQRAKSARYRIQPDTRNV
jgi:hypothetical protein